MERTEQKRKHTKQSIFAGLGIFILTVIVWRVHCNVPFMMDDLWYSTNLATGERLTGIIDIVDGQKWHYMNWGGRSITHGLLQVILMLGEPAADVLNVILFLMLSYVICVTAGTKSVLGFCMAESLLISLSANVKMSMFWESGVVNYMYSSVWILLFVWVYLRNVNKPEAEKLKGVELWMIPLGLMTGWSNENMGPACFLMSATACIYLFYVKHVKIRLWQLEGIAACLAGSILVIAAPGNFVRSGAIEKKGFLEELYERFYSMLRAGTEYLFPVLLLLVTVLLIWCVVLSQKLLPAQYMLLELAVLSYGAMFLSPHYPDRATFGTMAVCIVLIIWVLTDICRLKKGYRPSVVLLGFFYWCHAVYQLTGGFV